MPASGKRQLEAVASVIQDRPRFADIWEGQGNNKSGVVSSITGYYGK